jgi:hypothetical protein
VSLTRGSRALKWILKFIAGAEAALHAVMFALIAAAMFAHKAGGRARPVLYVANH